jgi:hypothetical protein
MASERFLTESAALAALKASALRLELDYEVVEGVVFSPELDRLPSNAAKRFMIYQSMAQTLGVVRKAPLLRPAAFR